MIIKQWFSIQSARAKKIVPSTENRQDVPLLSTPNDSTITPCSATRVPILKELLQNNGLPTIGKKSELYQRLIENGIKYINT
jgi:hypothetical protein